MFSPLPFLFSSVVSLNRSVFFFPLGRAILPNLAIQQQSSESKKRATLLTETWISRNHTAFRDFACHSTEQFCLSPRKRGIRLPKKIYVHKYQKEINVLNVANLFFTRNIQKCNGTWNIRGEVISHHFLMLCCLTYCLNRDLGIWHRYECFSHFFRPKP